MPMRLLQLGDHGVLSLTTFNDEDIPPYAILSHSWGKDEVLFQDLVKVKYMAKTGYKKLVFCGQQAAKDGIHFFWADTCCMHDMLNSVEMQNDINSMFGRYQGAAKCYVYLSDVKKGSFDQSLEKSKYFTLCWTLQELLAPKSVEFFDCQCERLGDKTSLSHTLHRITGIPTRALQGAPLEEFSVNERISWAESRETRVPEDSVYSLLGIFDVFMPVNFGEGRANALERLKEQITRRQKSLSSIPPTTSRYRALTGTGFRVLLLDPGEFGSVITGRLSECNLQYPPSYYALSYVWGQEPALHQVVINDAEVFIRPNLFHALQRIRPLRGAPIRLWMDTLCIDQQNDVERNAQVRQMAEIYNKAEGVFIWLGEEDSTSKLAIELVNNIYNGSRHSSTNMARYSFSWEGSWWRDYSFTALNLLLERPWFRRGWVLQEAAFSTNSIIQCGDKQLHMERFVEAAKLIRARINNESQAQEFLDNTMLAETLGNFIDSPAMRILDMIEGAFNRTKEGVIINHKLSLETLVNLATYSETSDARDTVYALLNMANDAGSSRRPNQNTGIIPDYRKSIMSVYAEYVMHCCKYSESLDVLCRPWAPIPHNQTTQLPSWIATKDKLPYGDPSWRLKHRIHGNPLVGNSSRRVYNAHYGTKPVVVEAPHSGNIDILTVKGVILGRVSEISSRMASAIIARDCLTHLGYLTNDPKYGTRILYRSLCAYRDGEGNPPSESWYRTAETFLNSVAYQDASGIDIEYLLEYLEPELPSSNPDDLRSFLTVVRDNVWNRRTFRAVREAQAPLERAEFLVGLVPARAHCDDKICILYGCSVPVVLRKRLDTQGRQYWQLVGDAYVHGIMEGEAISGAEQEILDKMEVDFEIR
jgi:hypothetical protein